MPDPNHHLTLKHQTWFFRLRVPADLRVRYGIKEIHKSLQTHSVVRARLERDVLLGRYRREFDQYRRDNRAGDLVLVNALGARRRIAEASDTLVVVDTGHERLTEREHAIDMARDTAEHVIFQVIGTDDPDDPEYAENMALYHRVSHGTTEPLKQLLDPWLGETKGAPKTLAEKRKVAQAFLGWMVTQRFVLVGDITRRIAARYVREEIAGRGVKPATVNKDISHLSSWWRWLDRRGHLDDDGVNPWMGQNYTINPEANGEDEDTNHRAWTADELRTLFNADPAAPGMRSATRATLLRFGKVALYTGARRGDLAGLKVGDVESRGDAGLWLVVRRGKTKAATRDIPVHSAIEPLVREMIQDRPADAWLFTGPGIIGKTASARANYVGKLWRDMTGALNLAPVLHGLRSTFIEHLEAAGVPLSTVKLIVGHRRDDITFGRYSKGSLVELRTEIEKMQVVGVFN
ncbi:site-specific recombinase XerD [Nitrospirillum amazonense]|uniref:Site-specific recombinase XerD n=1 Tax=Nitrospirillum amazonense TaxID=28077 RepID=A0A560FLY6_9PROT|nr:tyrosine-type recombinase/integrase [Nitrospirillum amazonense]TWB22595.1 site-specific recombinase XerD [Nitrospirillum amazonense]